MAQEHSLAVSMISCWPNCVDSPVSGAPQMGANNESELWDPVLITESRATQELRERGHTYGVCAKNWKVLFF